MGEEILGVLTSALTAPADCLGYLAELVGPETHRALMDFYGTLGGYARHIAGAAFYVIFVVVPTISKNKKRKDD